MFFYFMLCKVLFLRVTSRAQRLRDLRLQPETAKWRLTKEGDGWFGQLP